MKVTAEKLEQFDVPSAITLGLDDHLLLFTNIPPDTIQNDCITHTFGN